MRIKAVCAGTSSFASGGSPCAIAFGAPSKVTQANATAAATKRAGKLQRIERAVMEGMVRFLVAEGEFSPPEESFSIFSEQPQRVAAVVQFDARRRRHLRVG